MFDLVATTPTELLAHLKKLDSLLNKNREEPSTGFVGEFLNNSRLIFLRLIVPSVRAYIKGIKESPELVYYSNNIVQELVKASAFDINSQCILLYGNGKLIGLGCVLKFLETLWELVYDGYDSKQEVDTDDPSYYRELVFSFELIKDIFITVLSVSATNDQVIEWVLEIEQDAKDSVFASELYSVLIKCCLESNLSCEIENLISLNVQSNYDFGPKSCTTSMNTGAAGSYEFKQSTIIKSLNEVYNRWNSIENDQVKEECDYRIEAELTVLKTFAAILSKREEGINESNTVIQNLKSPFKSNNESPTACYKYYLTNRELVPAWTNIFNVPTGSFRRTFRENVKPTHIITEDKLELNRDKRILPTKEFGFIEEYESSEDFTYRSKNKETISVIQESMNTDAFWNTHGGSRIELTDDMPYITPVGEKNPAKGKRENIKDWFWNVWYPVDSHEEVKQVENHENENKYLIRFTGSM